jgi:hypothetical protein
MGVRSAHLHRQRRLRPTRCRPVAVVGDAERSRRTLRAEDRRDRDHRKAGRSTCPLRATCGSRSCSCGHAVRRKSLTGQSSLRRDPVRLGSRPWGFRRVAFWSGLAHTTPSQAIQGLAPTKRCRPSGKGQQTRLCQAAGRSRLAPSAASPWMPPSMDRAQREMIPAWASVVKSDERTTTCRPT